MCYLISLVRTCVCACSMYIRLYMYPPFFGRALDWFTALYICERSETAQPYLSEPTAEYRCAAAHPDNPARAGSIDMLMARLVAWNCHPVCIVRLNSTSAVLSSRLASLIVVVSAAAQSYRRLRRFPRLSTARLSRFPVRKAAIGEIAARESSLSEFQVLRVYPSTESTGVNAWEALSFSPLARERKAEKFLTKNETVGHCLM